MKRQEKKQPFNWTKIFVVLLCVVIAFAMVATYLSPMVGLMRTIRPNESVTADITIRDATGYPIITTDDQVFAGSPAQGFFLRNPMILKAGTNTSDIVTVDAYNKNTGWVQFSFHWLEINEISEAIIGMHDGETKTVKFDFDLPPELEFSISAQAFDQVGGNFTSARVGDWLTTRISTNETQQGGFRLATILEKTDDTIVISSKYSAVDITIENFGDQ